MDASSTEDAITQAIKQADAHLVQLAMGLCDITPQHLRLAQDIDCQATRLAVCRLLVRRGANPYEGFPTAIDLACSRGLEHEAWSMAAAWLDCLALISEPAPEA